MGKQSPANVAAPVLAHGAARLSAVEVADYNVELKDDEGFIGDRASKGAFRKFIENWRKPLRDLDHDPFGDEPSSKIAKKNSISCSPAAIRKPPASFKAPSNHSRRNSQWCYGAFSSSRAGRTRRA